MEHGLVDNLANLERLREKFAKDANPNPKKLMDNIAAAKKELSDFDKRFNSVNSIRILAEVTDKFFKLDTEVNDLHDRIHKATIDLAHQVSIRELQLEKLVQELNRFAV